MYAIVGHEVWPVGPSVERGADGEEVTFPEGWVVLTRLLSWRSAEAVAEGTEKLKLAGMASSKLLEHFDEALEARQAAEDALGGAGADWRGASHRVEEALLRFPSTEKEEPREGFVVGHVVVLRQHEERWIDRKKFAFGFQAVAYVAVCCIVRGGTCKSCGLEGDAQLPDMCPRCTGTEFDVWERREVFHMRVTDPGQFPVEPNQSLADRMSGLYWAIRSDEITANGERVGYPFGFPVSFRKEGRDYRMYTPPPPEPPSWLKPPTESSPQP